MPNEIDQMTEQEFLERVWIATYAAAYVQYPGLYKERPVDALKRTQHAWIQAGDAVEDLIYSTYALGDSNSRTVDHFMNALVQCKNGAIRRYDKLEEEYDG